MDDVCEVCGEELVTCPRCGKKFCIHCWNIVEDDEE